MRAIAGSLFSLLAVACGDPHTVEIRLFTDDDPYHLLDPDPEVRALLDQAGDLLRRKLVPVRNAPIDIELVDTRGGYVGRASKLGLCRYHARSSYDSQVLAHELAHVLGLEHVSEEDDRVRFNLMQPGIRGVELTGNQYARMDRTSTKIERWCWDSTEPTERSSSRGETLCELAGPLVGDQPERVRSEQTLGAGEATEPGVVQRQEAATAGDEAGTTGLREDGTSTGWSIFFEWL